MKRPAPADPRSIRYKMRRARFKWIERLLDQVLEEKSSATILDIGGRGEYWSLLDPKYRKLVHIVTVNREEEMGWEKAPLDNDLQIEAVTGDGTSLPQFADGSFDIAHSNSVIEHVGLYSQMADFAAETRRIGRAYYLQTPNFWFPLEPHYGIPFFHWLPETTRLYLHSHSNVGFVRRTTFEDAMARVDHTRIVSRRVLKHLFPDGVQASERFALLTKSLIVYRDF